MVSTLVKKAADPLGVFDSGLGGLTVVRAIAHTLPGEAMVYFGDTARLPYGNKSPRTVRRLSLEALKFLEHFEIKAWVVACNSASALALHVLTDEATVPVLGVVEAGARQAVAKTRNRRIGVIGTRATVASHCYPAALERLGDGFQVTSAACPLFVSLVEEGWVEHEVTRQVAAEYLEPVRRAGVDTLILGCTHYPLLKKVISDVMGNEVTLIDSGEALAADLLEQLTARGLLAPKRPVEHRFFVSDQSDRFQVEGQRFLGEAVIGRVEAVDQSDLPWYDRPSRTRGHREDA
jgi:glutamate racemase